MIKPSIVTLTGADNSTDIQHLFDLSEKYPFVEWAILYSATEGKQGTPRYPDRKWIESLCNAKLLSPWKSIRLSLHVCGKNALSHFLYDDPYFNIISEFFNRIQLNFNYLRLKETNTFPDFNTKLKFGLYRRNNHSIITQYNKNNIEVPGILENFGNHQVLFDSSGGTGKTENTWPNGFPFVGCGYAGGLSPDNILDQLKNIYPCVLENHQYWVDMESSLRTVDNDKDIFDLIKCERVLTQIDSI